MSQAVGFLESFFKLKENKTNTKTEAIAGMTTFLTMAYILFVNPQILSQTGMDYGAVFTATALAAAVSTLVMGVLANLPFALAPGMGLNAFFAFTVCIAMNQTWQFALTAVFLEGIFFLLLTFFGIRQAIMNCIPLNLKKAISVGIGLFIAFIGLVNSGIILPSQGTPLTIGALTSGSALLALIGIIVSGLLLAFNVHGALFFGILITSLVGIPMGLTTVPERWASMPPAPILFAFEWDKVFTPEFASVFLTFFFVDLFDTVGTLVGVSTKAGMLNEKGEVPNASKALLADAIGTTFGAMIGTSTTTTYVESAAGVAAGGRTGLASVFTALLFAASLFFAPIFGMIPPAATAPALVIVGLFMMSPIQEIDFDDFTEAIPAFLCIIMMPLAYSIAEGMIFGIIAYVILKVGTGRHKEVDIVTYFVAFIFALKIIFGH